MPSFSLRVQYLCAVPLLSSRCPSLFMSACGHTLKHVALNARILFSLCFYTRLIAHGSIYHFFSFVIGAVVAQDEIKMANKAGALLQ